MVGDKPLAARALQRGQAQRSFRDGAADRDHQRRNRQAQGEADALVLRLVIRVIDDPPYNWLGDRWSIIIGDRLPGHFSFSSIWLAESQYCLCQFVFRCHVIGRNLQINLLQAVTLALQRQMTAVPQPRK